MLDWLKFINKEHPEFWKTYLSKFDSKTKVNRFVILSTETSGLNPEKDVLFSFAAVAIVDDSIVISDNFDLILLQNKYLEDNDIPNDFLKESKVIKLAEPQAVEAFIDYLGNAVLVGYHINSDIEMINKALDKINCGRLKNEALDIEIMHKRWIDNSDKSFTLNELCTSFKIPISERQTSSENSYAIALLFLKLKSRLGIH